MRVARWRGATVATTVAVALGLYVGHPAVVLVGVVPLAYVAYGYLSTLGEPALDVEREIDDDSPVPGDAVAVRLRVENVGDRTVPDLRVVDGVPEPVPVVEGAATACTALRPGDAVTVEYTVRPPRGDHEFDPPTVRARNLAGTVVDTRQVAPAGDAGITCQTLLDEFPVHREPIQYVGGVTTDLGGSGVEFHTTREYRPGDPLNRIDWNRLARTGELTTVEFRTERSVVVVFVVDDREAARVEPPGGGPDGVDLATYAASRGVATLLDAGHRVGVASLRAIADGLRPGEWVEPGGDATTRQAASEQLAAIGAGADADASGTGRAGAGRSETERAGTPGGPEDERDDREEDEAVAAPDDEGDDGQGVDEGDDEDFWGSIGTDGDRRQDRHEDPDDGLHPDRHEEPDGDRSQDRSGETDGGNRDGEREGDPGEAIDGDDLGLRLAEQLPSRAQVVVCSPLVDDVPTSLVIRLLATGHAASVVSPDVFGTGESSPGRSVAAIERANRVFDLQSRGVPAADWELETPLSVALSTAFARWRGVGE